MGEQDRERPRMTHRIEEGDFCQATGSARDSEEKKMKKETWLRGSKERKREDASKCISMRETTYIAKSSSCLSPSDGGRTEEDATNE